MPALKPCPGAAHAQFFHTMAGRTVSVNLSYSDGNLLEYTPTDIDDLANALAAAWVTNIVPHLSQDITFNSVEVTDLFSGDAPRTVVEDDHIGGDGVGAEPLNVAMVVKAVIPHRYRGGKGHIYIPGIPVGFRTADDFWTSPILTTFLAGVNSVTDAAVALTTSHGTHWAGVVVSRFSAHVERDPAIYRAILDYESQPRVCTRRRRLPKITA